MLNSSQELLGRASPFDPVLPVFIGPSVSRPNTLSASAITASLFHESSFHVLPGLSPPTDPTRSPPRRRSSPPVAREPSQSLPVWFSVNTPRPGEMHSCMSRFFRPHPVSPPSASEQRALLIPELFLLLWLLHILPQTASFPPLCSTIP